MGFSVGSGGFTTHPQTAAGYPPGSAQAGIAANGDGGDKVLPVPIPEEDSPFPEVRASVSNVDDPEMPCLTFRVWVIGLFFTVVGAGFNLYFNIRYPSPLITPITVQVVSYPVGKFLAYLLPVDVHDTPDWLVRLGFTSEWSLNPGPFNIKEHAVIVIMANVSIAPAYALNFTIAMDRFYNAPKGIGFDFLTVLTTNVIGFSFAGICRRFLVWPASLIWPSNLVSSALFNTFHAEDDDGSDGSLPRYKLFTFVLGGAFFWYALPGKYLQLLTPCEISVDERYI